MPERPSLAEALRPVADAKPDAAKPRGRRGKRGIVTYIETETARQLKVLAAPARHDAPDPGVEAWHLLSNATARGEPSGENFLDRVVHHGARVVGARYGKPVAALVSSADLEGGPNAEGDLKCLRS